MSTCWSAGSRRSARAAGGDLHVLLAHRVDQIACRQPELGEAFRVEPDTHRIATLAEDADAAHARHALQCVEHVDVGVVREEERVARAVGRAQVRHEREVGRLLVDRDAEAAHLLGQARLRHRHAVVDVHRRDVGIAPQLEGDGQAHLPVVGAGRGHVEHALGAVHLVLDGQREGALDHVGTGAVVAGRDLNGGRHDRGELGDRQQRDRDGTGQRDQDRHHRGEDRAVDEEGDEARRTGSCGRGGGGLFRRGGQGAPETRRDGRGRRRRSRGTTFRPGLPSPGRPGTEAAFGGAPGPSREAGRETAPARPTSRGTKSSTPLARGPCDDGAQSSGRKRLATGHHPLLLAGPL